MCHSKGAVPPGWNSSQKRGKKENPSDSPPASRQKECTTNLKEALKDIKIPGIEAINEKNKLITHAHKKHPFLEKYFLIANFKKCENQVSSHLDIPQSVTAGVTWMHDAFCFRYHDIKTETKTCNCKCHDKMVTNIFSYFYLTRHVFISAVKEKRYKL
jgi:hypothetical protein